MQARAIPPQHKSISVTLRAERVAQGLSQWELAARTGVTRITIQSVEAGKAIKSTTLIDICKALGLSFFVGTHKVYQPRKGEQPLNCVEKKKYQKLLRHRNREKFRRNELIYLNELKQQNLQNALFRKKLKEDNLRFEAQQRKADQVARNGYNFLKG